jgi:hypothetical protein
MATFVLNSNSVYQIVPPSILQKCETSPFIFINSGSQPGDRRADPMPRQYPKVIEDPTIDATARVLAEDGINEIERLIRCGRPWYVARTMFLEENQAQWVVDYGAKCAKRAATAIMSYDFQNLENLSDQTRDYLVSKGHVSRPVTAFIEGLIWNPLLIPGLIMAYFFFTMKPHPIQFLLMWPMNICLVGAVAWAWGSVKIEKQVGRYEFKDSKKKS